MKRIISLFLILLLSFSLFACNGNGGDQNTNGGNNGKDGIENEQREQMAPLVENGSSRYTVIIPESASACILYAAEELNNFLKQSTGVSLKIVKDSESELGCSDACISIGKTRLLSEAELNVDYLSLNQDGFIIKTVDKSIFIDGYLERGTLYGVYSFLERNIGIRFLTADCTYIPKLSKINLYVEDIKDIPDVIMRQYLKGDIFEGWADAAFAARTRQDTSYFPGGVVVDKYGEPSTLYKRISEHNMHFYVPEEIYNDPSKPEAYHPEFYYQFPAPYESYGPTICLTNGLTADGKLDAEKDVSVAKIVVEEMYKDIIANPSARFFMFEQEDSNNCCQCDTCKETANIYKRSGILIRFCNMMIEEIERKLENDGIKINFEIVTFAYSYATEPPVKVENDEMVPIDSTVVADEKLCMRLAQMHNVKDGAFSPNQRIEIVRAFKEWKVIAKRFMLWLYDADFEDWISYFPSLNTIKETVDGLIDFGAIYVLMQGPQFELQNWQSNLRGYIYRNLLWDSSLNVDALKNEYIDLYYGETAAPYVKRFVENYDMNYAVAIANNPDLIVMSWEDQYLDPLKGCLTLPFLLSQINIIDDAKETVLSDKNLSASDKEIILKRLSALEVTPMYTIHRFYRSFYSLSNADQEHEFLVKMFDLMSYSGIMFIHEGLTVSSLKASLNIL